MKYLIYFKFFSQLISEQHLIKYRLHGIVNKILLLLCYTFLFGSTLYAQDGSVYNKSVTIDGVIRDYILYVPAAYDGEEEWPLVINYHAYRSTATYQMNVLSKMNLVADTAHFLIAYPQGLSVKVVESPETSSPDSAKGWSIPGEFEGKQDDIAFTDSLIVDVERDFKIDASRIHATGWSNGSLMSLYLAAIRSERIASIAGVSGYMSTAMMDSTIFTRPISVLLMHGTADPISSFNGTQDIAPPAPATTSFWARQNNCSLDSTVTELPDLVKSDSNTVTLIRYTGCDENTEVLFYQINNGGHGWPGGPSFPFIGSTNQDIIASLEIWNFFKRNPHPDYYTSIENITTSLKSFELYQNYPNPFNPSTIIGWLLPLDSYVDLSIYNILGQKVATLVNEKQPAGSHSVEFDAKDFVSGMYIYKLKTGSFEQSRKMVLIR